MQKIKHILMALVLCSITTFSFAQLNGIYRIGTTPIGGENGFYPSLAAAVTALNTSGVSGPCTFYFSDNTTYTEAADIALGCATASATNTVTFKPFTGVTCTISFTNTGTRTIDGHFVIGASDAAAALPGSLKSTNYITFDGSNTDGGTTKNLTINGAATSSTKSVFRVYGNNNDIVIKNCIINNNSTSATTTAPVTVTNYFNSTNYTPDNITIQNNTLACPTGTANGAAGLIFNVSGSATTSMSGISIVGNSITSKGSRSILLNTVISATVSNNIIDHNPSGLSGTPCAGILFLNSIAGTGTIDVFNNSFITLTTANTNASGTNYGIVGFDNQLGTGKVVNIYNNVIRGFRVNSATVTNSTIYGIRHTGASTTNAYNNSIYLPDLTNMTNFSTSYIAGIVYASTTESSPSSSGTFNIKNNIIFMDESSMKVYAIRRVGANGTLVCDNNVLYVNPANALGHVGFINGIDEPSFLGWQTTSGHDANSFNINPNFTSTTNLTPTLAGYLPGSNSLFSTTDFNGVTRSTTKPHIGAYESTAKHWLGTTSDWATASNWRDGIIPSLGDNVIIGYNSVNPNLPSDITVGIIGLQEGVQLTIGSNTLTINGSINGVGTLTGSVSSNLTLGGLAGTVNLTSGARSLKFLTLTAGSTATLGTPLDIAGGTIPGIVTVGTGAALTTGGNLTLKSDVNGTARIANSAGTINGNVTTEVFIPGGRRAYRFLGHPFTAAQTMSSLVDDIFVTGAGAGFDVTATNAASSFWFDDALNAWTAFASTSDASWAQHRGTRVLVRGDRTQTTTLTSATPPAPNAVTLDMTGAVNTGNQTINLTNANNYHLVSNPYPSPTDIGTVIQAASNLGTLYWVWNANTGTRGQYVSRLITDGAYNLAMNGAFFVLPTASTSLAFTESNKQATATQALFRTANSTRPAGYLELAVKQNNEIADNIYIRDLASSSTTKDVEDGGKLINPDINIYTLSSNNEQLTLDSRPISSTTVIPVAFTSNMQSSFSIDLIDNGFGNGLPIVLKDKFLNTEHVLTATSPYNFTVTSNAASQGTNRFELVFKSSAALPTNFVSVAAQQKGSAIEVTFNTTNETNMHSYEVEESKDGSTFTKGTTLEAKNATTNNYSWLDVNVHNGNNYYRIKAIEKNGAVKYSQVVRVNIGTKRSEFTVYPNPVKGGTINLQLTDIEKGVYTVKVVNNLGQEIATKVINHNGGSATQTISIGNAATGKYNMVITNGTTSITKTVIVE